MNHQYDLIAIKRRYVPNWLYWLFCRRLPFFGQPALIQPFRWLLNRKA